MINTYSKKFLLLTLALPLTLHCQPAFATEETGSDDVGGLLSAFFGLDNDLPFLANRLCLGASGMDGMPVVLSRTVDEETLQAEDFEVTTREGVKHTPHCVTLRPAQDAGELRTVLLIGEFGNADEDPPKSVHVVGDLLSDGVDGGETVNFVGSNVDVIPLSAGPTLVLAQRIPVENLARDTRGTTCPEDVAQVVRVTWTGGVRLPSREDPGDAERQLYQVSVERKDGSLVERVPVALADLGDGDNNHLLCLDTVDRAVSVSFPAGVFVDPNRDLNPDTNIAVGQGNN